MKKIIRLPIELLADFFFPMFIWVFIAEVWEPQTYEWPKFIWLTILAITIVFYEGRLKFMEASHMETMLEDIIYTLILILVGKGIMTFGSEMGLQGYVLIGSVTLATSLIGECGKYFITIIEESIIKKVLELPSDFFAAIAVWAFIAEVWQPQTYEWPKLIWLVMLAFIIVFYEGRIKYMEATEGDDILGDIVRVAILVVVGKGLMTFGSEMGLQGYGLITYVTIITSLIGEIGKYYITIIDGNANEDDQ